MDLPRQHADSVDIAASPEVVYDLVSDVTRTGEWSPICRSCEWDDPAEAGQVGAMFTGHNETPTRQWSTRSQVVAADRPRERAERAQDQQERDMGSEPARRSYEFAWEVGPGFVRWGYELAPIEGGTRLTESWHFLDGGIEMFRTRFGDDADAQVADRTQAALNGIPVTLQEIKRVAEDGARG